MLATVAGHRAELTDLALRGAGDDNLATMLAIEGKMADRVIMIAVEPCACKRHRPEAGHVIRVVVIALSAEADHSSDSIFGYNSNDAVSECVYVLSKPAIGQA